MFKKIVALTFLTAILIACDATPKSKIDASTRLNLASTYYNSGLYVAAISEYQLYLAENDVDLNRQANTIYTIANIYFEREKNYEKALEFYLKLKHLYPQSTLQKETAKKIVSCLERLRRTKDANRYVQNESALSAASKVESKPGEVVATIGKRKITQGDIDFEISQLPAAIQQQLEDKSARQAFLEQFVVQELMYDSAKRQGFDTEKDIIEATFRAQKSLMVEKVIQAETGKELQISEADVELFYKANKERYSVKDKNGNATEIKPFNTVRQEVARDFVIQKQQEVYNQLAERLIRSNNVQIFKQKLK